MLYFTERGSGPPLLLVHGLMITGEMFDPVIEQLATRHRVSVPDLRGHGRSRGLPPPYSASQLAADLTRLLDDLAIGSTAVLGYSQGGAIAQQLALDDPARCDRLVLACTYAFNMATAREKVEGHLVPLLVQVLGMRRFAELVLAQGLKQVDKRRADWVVGLIADQDRKAMVGAWKDAMAFDSRGRLAEIRCPTLVVAASRNSSTLDLVAARASSYDSVEFSPAGAVSSPRLIMSFRVTRTIALVAVLMGTTAVSSSLGAQRDRGRQQAAAIAPATLDSLRAHIRRVMDSTKTPSIAVAVAKGGRIIWEEGFGFADVEHRTPATPTTLYSMASISKPITATGLMKLVEQGKIDLDRPANDYLGAAKITGLAGPATGATVRRVMSHTAGLPLHYRFFYAGGAVTRPSMDEAISRYAIVVYPPGAVYNYSNLGYGVLEEIIAKVSGKSYETFMHDEVFTPLGMTTTTIGTGAGIANSAVRYSADWKPVAYYDFDHRAASAVYTSAHELVRFGMFHLKDHLADQRPILKDATLDAMHRRETPGDTANGYGLGWQVSNEQGMRVVSHTGGMPGVATTLKLYPEQNMAIVALANTSGAAPHRIAVDIAAAVVPGYTVPAPRATVAAFTAPAELTGEWTGTVRMYDGSTTPIALLVKSDDVHVRLGNAPDVLWTVLNSPTFRNNLLGGQFDGTIPSEEARRFPQNVGVSLLLQGDTLRGWAAAMTTDDPLTGAMSSYAELTRKPAVSSSGK